MRPKTMERERARELRRQGLTYAEIAEQLTVAKSTVSLWVRDLPRPARRPPTPERLATMTSRQAIRRRQRHLTRQNTKLAWAAQIGALTSRELEIAGAVAYWAEGSKAKPWRPQEKVVFVNSDPGMVRLFLNYLQAVGVEEARLRYQVHVHESADVAAAVSFWAQVVGVATDRFQPPVLKRDRPRTNRHNVGAGYHGCLSVRVTGAAELYRRIEGTWWAVRAAAKATSSVRENARITRPEVDPISGLPLRLARVRRILRRGRRAWASA